MKNHIKSLLIEGCARIYVSESEPEFYLGTEYYKTITPMRNEGLWFCCYNFDNELVKRINGRYVVDVEY
jgi:hypothetical protein